MSDVVLYNTRTRRKEKLVPLEEGHVRMYSCGPTVYGPQHIGNLRPYLFADLLKRTLCGAGLRVTHVINITDVGHLTDDASDGEDKMEVAAQKTGRQAEEIAREYEVQWKRDCDRVGCLPADVYCRATEHISEQIELGRGLEEKGYLYRAADGMYFDTSRFPRYADFAHLDLAAQSEGERIEGARGKRNIADFAIWKFPAEEARRQQEWDSPWGRGFPGWHLECSAMSSKYLGRQFDIHTGGMDHVPVHHTNEIAQSECGFDVHPWVTIWLHNAFITFAGGKMAKSKGNVALLDDLAAAGVEPLAYRYFFLQATYRQPQTFSEEGLAGATNGYRRLLTHVMEVRDETGEGDAERQAPYLERFTAALRDDLNAPQGVAVAWEVARSAELPAPDRRDLLLAFDEILGLDLASAVPPEARSESDPRIDARVAARDEARRSRDFETADRIRDELLAEGIVIVDAPEGSRWRRK